MIYNKNELINLGYTGVLINKNSKGGEWISGVNKHGQTVACDNNSGSLSHFKKWAEYNKSK